MKRLDRRQSEGLCGRYLDIYALLGSQDDFHTVGLVILRTSVLIHSKYRFSQSETAHIRLRRCIDFLSYFIFHYIEK